MYADVGLLILRVVVGGVVLAHGLQKLGMLGGGGVAGTTGFMASLRFTPSRPWALIVTLAETVGAILMILGLLGPIGPGIVAADLIVAVIAFHVPKGFWNAGGGYEYVLVIAAGALANTLIGHGAYSLDASLRLTYPDWLLPAWLVAVAVGAAAAMASRSMGAKPQA
jgi:putative oxidoreductase